MEASIIIPTMLLDTEIFRECLQSLDKQTYPHKKYEIIIIINGSKKKLPYTFKNIRVIRKRKNIGFTGAVNEGIRQAKGKYILPFNDDAIADKHWLTSIIATHQKTQADMVASVIYQLDFHDIHNPQKNDAPIDSCGFTFAWRGKAQPLSSTSLYTKKAELQNVSDYWLKHPDLFSSQDTKLFFQEPFGPDAAACLYTKKMVEDIGLLDESFFAYLEDVELALRARKKGYHSVVSPKAKVYHVKHATSQSMGYFKAKQDMINWWRIILKHYPWKVYKKFGITICIERLKNIKGFLSQLR